jgi:outer membrane protein
MKTFGMLAGALALAAAVSTGAAAQELRGKKAGDFVIGLGAIGVLPQNAGGSTSLIGGKVEANDAVTPQLDFT